jgi:hypothetical protein
MMMSPLEILNRSGWMAMRAVKKSAYGKKRWAEDAELRKKTVARSLAWRRTHKYVQRVSPAQRQRINLLRRMKYKADLPYRERLLDAMRRRQQGMSLTRQRLPEVYDLPWNADLLQEAALAELEGRDPKEAMETFRKRENEYLFSTTPYPMRFGREISI